MQSICPFNELPISAGSQRQIRFQAALKEIAAQELEVNELINRHLQQLSSPRAVDRRYHVLEVKHAKIRLCSLKNLSVEIERRLYNLQIEMENGHENNETEKVHAEEETCLSQPYNKEKGKGKGAPVAYAERDYTHEILVSQETFFAMFFEDLERARKSVEIVCPFVSNHRIDVVQRLAALARRGLKCVIYTRPPETESGRAYLEEAQRLKIEVVERNKWHHKVAIIDDKICWEGSLNILCHNTSEDTMRKLIGRKYASDHRRILKLAAVD